MEAELLGQKPSARRRSRVSISPPAGGTPGVAASCSRYPLRRGSSFTFLTPGPHWDFTLKRKRREKDDDAVSLSSLDFKVGLGPCEECLSREEAAQVFLQGLGVELGAC
ncbi:neuroepithelial cell-transforming gene 1 protein-like [Ammospiza caudacuta]|uniref:neuroepithelial cell-transforming gene 1 protein-like n=1 Tax=Ammospiza caudacuta TaxID=2857398 RepID=UPI0027389C44|nr:neuroepithelial cell-transforming gene 1 protein-like [Ammospiza caudacuta]